VHRAPSAIGKCYYAAPILGRVPSERARSCGTTTSSATRPTEGYSATSRPAPTTAPTACAMTKPGTDAGAIPAKDYIAAWNTNPAPFTWTATADEILAKVQLVQTNIKKLVDNNAK
jgi:hypothetical protein